MSPDPALVWVVRLGIVALFGASVVHKLRDPAAFESSVRGYGLLPSPCVRVGAGLLMGLEALVFLTVWLPALDPLGGTLGFGLLALYSAAIGVNLARGRTDIDCGCLGPAFRQSLSPFLLIRNGLLMLATLALLVDPSARALHWVDGVTIIGGLMAVVLLWSAAHQLAGGSSRPRPAGSSA